MKNLTEKSDYQGKGWQNHVVKFDNFSDFT